MKKIKSYIIDKIFENLNKTDIKSGIVIASISKSNPNYYYHWIRDSAIVMKLIVNHYINTGDLRCFKQIIDYIENETHLQKVNTISGLGEPKYNVDRTAFNESWGRPQNDGPALRGLTMILIYNIFKDNYKELCILVKDIIIKDLNYIIDNINVPSYDLWEELYGYHLYTRAVQCKFLKSVKSIFTDNEILVKIDKSLKIINSLITHHTPLHTSYDINGNISRRYDISLFLALNHIDYDTSIINFFSESFKNHVVKLINFYKNEYKINKNLDFIFVGRYKDDVYFDGNPWIITTASLTQLLILYNKNNITLKDINIDKHINNFIEYIKNNKTFNFAEQIDKDNGYQISAKNLTWNYSELYNMFDIL